MIGPSPWHIAAHRLLKRSLLLSLAKGRLDNPNMNEPEYVCWYLDHNTGHETRRLGDMFRNIGLGAGISPKQLQLYSPDEMRLIAMKLAWLIESTEPDGTAGESDKELASTRRELWPNWPDGWREAYESVNTERRRVEDERGSHDA